MRWKIKPYVPPPNKGYFFLLLPKKFDHEWLWLEWVNWEDKNAFHNHGHSDCPHIVYFDSKGEII